jgi:hypothetical protein
MPLDICDRCAPRGCREEILTRHLATAGHLSAVVLAQQLGDLIGSRSAQRSTERRCQTSDRAAEI